jgi:hypothetical protein
MMIKVSDGYLDFDGEVEMERQVKLFEDIKETWGDFSYTFELALTDKNLSLLGLPLPDNKSKIVYNKVTADLLSDSGEILFKGYLRIERVNTVIETSFFSGNNNWLGSLTGNMTELRLDSYDQVLSEANIVARVSATSGIVFPLIDTGALVTRSYHNLKVEDFAGCFYLKDLMRETFSQSGLKMDGELLSDPLYNSLVVVTNTRSKTEVDRHSISVGANSGQVIPLGGSASMDFTLTTNPYFVGESATFATDSIYSAGVDMIVDVSASFEFDSGLIVTLNRSGSPGSLGFASGTRGTINAKGVKLSAGQTLSVNLTDLFSGGPTTVIKGIFKVTPRFIYKAFGRSSVPLWSKEDFVSNIFSLFNVITDYDPYTKTVTANLFNKLKTKEAIDISDYIQVEDTDYTDFISNYGKNSTLSYQESDDEDLREYNIGTFYKYGVGVIEVDNEFLEESAPLLESDFSAPISYIHPAFNASLEKINFIELTEEDKQDITSVTDSSGTPRFNITDADDFYEVNDLVRLEMNNIAYNGDYVVDAVTSTYITVRGLVFDSDATGEVKKLIHGLTTDDSVYLMINSGERNVEDFSKTNDQIYIEGTTYSSASLAFFNLINNATQFNQDYKQSLSFGEIVDPLFYQRTMIDTYWSSVKRVLNDPVKLTSRAYFPEHIHRRLTPLAPVTIKTLESVNTYYVQRETGYKGSYIPCTIELIKLP